MNEIEERLFEELYKNALQTYKIKHLDCTFLREFSKAMYKTGYSSGFYDGVDNAIFNDTGIY